MPSDISVVDAVRNFLSFFGDLIFKWIPGLVLSVAQSPATTGIAQAPSAPPITDPITVPQIVDYLNSISGQELFQKIVDWWAIVILVSVLVSLPFAALLIYSVVRLIQLRRHEFHHYETIQHTVAEVNVPKTQLRWQRIRDQVRSEDEQQARLAILEADIMLNELLDVLGYRGETMAEKMRQVPRSSFQTIDMAWEAHKVRNKIAHEGSEHPISVREADRVIGMYEKIFREFKFVE